VYPHCPAPYAEPVRLLAAVEALAQEESALAGAHCQRETSAHPHGHRGLQQGSAFLGDQKLPIPVPRVRIFQTQREVPREIYQALQVARRLGVG